MFYNNQFHTESFWHIFSCFMTISFFVYLVLGGRLHPSPLTITGFSTARVIVYSILQLTWPASVQRHSLVWGSWPTPSRSGKDCLSWVCPATDTLHCLSPVLRQKRWIGLRGRLLGPFAKWVIKRAWNREKRRVSSWHFHERMKRIGFVDFESLKMVTEETKKMNEYRCLESSTMMKKQF